MKKHLSTIILVAVLIVGLSLLLYPTVSDYWNSLHHSKAIASYVDEISNLDSDIYEKLWSDAEDFNNNILQRKNVYLLSEEDKQLYESVLDPAGNGIMGYVEIPSIGTSLPIYHTTEESVLQIGAGHMEWTSLPIGGINTHSVISSHRGLPAARLFTDLDKLATGDVFTLRVLNEILTYEVDQILIVKPNQTQALRIEEGQDLCTLVTCTPYGINTHRLLIRGHRIENPEDVSELHITADALQIKPMLIAPMVALPILLVLLTVLLIPKKKKRGGPEYEDD